jgi:WD40 repeat protein
MLFSFSLAQHQEMKKIDPSKYRLLSQSTNFNSKESVLVVLFDETGGKLLTGGTEKKLRCFDVGQDKLLWNVEGDHIEANAAADLYSLDVPFLAVGNNMFSGGGVQVYHWETGEMLGSLSPFARGMHSLAYGSSGVVFWFGPGGLLFGYSIVKNAFVTSNSGLSGHVNDGNTVRMGPYENLYTVGVDGQFIKWKNTFDRNTQSVSYTGEKDLIFKAEYPLTSLALNKYIKNSDDGKAGRIYAAIGENKGLVRIFALNDRKDGSTPNSFGTFQVEEGYVSNLAFHSTDPDLLVITGKKALLFYDFKTKSVQYKLEMSSDIKGFDMSIDGTKLAVGLMNGEVRVYSLN